MRAHLQKHKELAKQAILSVTGFNVAVAALLNADSFAPMGDKGVKKRRQRFDPL